MKFRKKDLITIPNLLGYFRILLIPVFLYIYLNAEQNSDYYRAALIIGISGLTDFLDGFVARTFHQVTELGKLLDPVADKLTQAALVLALCSRYRLMAAILLLFLVKEGFMVVMGIVFLRRGRKLDGAMWFGKVCTAVLYAVMLLLLLFPGISLGTANGLTCVCGGVLLFSFVMYIKVYCGMWKESQNDS